jgi:hypothetical protein
MLIVRIAQTVTTYRNISKFIWLNKVDSSSSKPISALVWSIVQVAKVVPGSNCLTRALSLQYLLGRSGHDSTIRIGVSDSQSKGFEAHAWVIHDGYEIIGHLDEDISRFSPIVDLRPQRKC